MTHPALNIEGIREMYREVARGIREMPERSKISIQSERWALWIALGSLALVYLLAWIL